MTKQSATPQTAVQNIDTVVRMEEQFLASRSTVDRAADAITAFIGSIYFVWIHLVVFAAWVAANRGWIPGIKPWDPYPFILLALIVSCEGVLLSTFVLMKQNRMSARADQRAHLNLQIDLLAENEVTKILQLVQELCKHQGIERATTDTEVQELTQVTAVDNLAENLRNKLPEE